MIKTRRNKQVSQDNIHHKRSRAPSKKLLEAICDEADVRRFKAMFLSTSNKRGVQPSTTSIHDAATTTAASIITKSTLPASSKRARRTSPSTKAYESIEITGDNDTMRNAEGSTKESSKSLSQPEKYEVFIELQCKEEDEDDDDIPTFVIKEDESSNERENQTSSDDDDDAGCAVADMFHLLTEYRINGQHKFPTTQGGRGLLRAVKKMRTPLLTSGGTINDPFGCVGFRAIKGFLTDVEQSTLVSEIGDTPAMYSAHVSSLTHNVGERSWKAYCCDDNQRMLRGGRYSCCPLKKTQTYVPVVHQLLSKGLPLDDVVESLFPSADPFVTSNKILCQQITWNMQDLEPHCDKERQDKTHISQPSGMDGVGDRITSLTLKKSCWLLMRRTMCHADCFALRLDPGDLYSISGEARWKWQHGIYLDDMPESFTNSRISLVWRILEQYPDE